MISDIEHYLQHSHGDGRIFVSGNVVGKNRWITHIFSAYFGLFNNIWLSIFGANAGAGAKHMEMEHTM